MDPPTPLSIGIESIDNLTNKNVDQLSNLPNHILVKILSNLTTEESIKTSILSKRWISVWKTIPSLFFDMQKIPSINGMVLPLLVNRGASEITKIMNNHVGFLETCTILHYTYQCENGRLNDWIQLLTEVKHTKNLILVNFLGRLIPHPDANVLNLSEKSFSHQDLIGLTLSRYILSDAIAFNDCCNIKKLELVDIYSEVEIFNQVLASCPSLEVLFLQIFFHNPDGCLKIDKKKLKMMLMTCNEVNGINIIATSLDCLCIGYALCASNNVVLKVPRLKFKNNYWVGGSLVPHTSCNISAFLKEKEENGTGLMGGLAANQVTTFTSLSISVDMKNPREVKVLKESLGLWTVKMIDLEILFKNNNFVVEDGEPSTYGAQNNLLGSTKPFPNTYFQVDTVWIYNFNGSRKEEFALVSRFVMQNTVMKKMMIHAPPYPKKMWLKIKETVADLMELPKGNEDMGIECFY